MSSRVAPGFAGRSADPSRTSPGIEGGAGELEVINLGRSQSARVAPQTGLKRQILPSSASGDRALLPGEREWIEAQRLGRIGFWLWEVEPDRVTWSSGLYLLTGRNPARPLPSFAEHHRIFAPGSWTCIQHVVQQSLRYGKPFSVALEMKRADATTLWVQALGEVVRNASGKVILLRGTVQDITQRLHRERTLLGRERELNEAQRLGRIGSWHWDVTQDRVSWSPFLYRLMGTESDKAMVRYRDLGRYFTRESRQRLQRAVKRTLATRESYELELELNSHRGGVRWVRVHGEPECDPEGRVKVLRGTSQDITRLKLAEQAFLALRRRFTDFQEDERRRFARRLHDDVAQVLASVSLRLHALENLAPAAQPRVISEVRGLVRDAMREVHRVSQSIRPSALDDLGFIPALRSLLTDFQARTRRQVLLRPPARICRLPAQVEAAFLRITQTVLAEIELHAGAESVSVHLRVSSRQAQLRLESGGRAILAEVPASGDERSTRVALLREWATLAGGNLRVHRPTEGGIRLTVSCPLETSP